MRYQLWRRRMAGKWATSSTLDHSSISNAVSYSLELVTTSILQPDLKPFSTRAAPPGAVPDVVHATT
jgi:hypothetical protein